MAAAILWFFGCIELVGVVLVVVVAIFVWYMPPLLYPFMALVYHIVLVSIVLLLFVQKFGIM